MGDVIHGHRSQSILWDEATASGDKPANGLYNIDARKVRILQNTAVTGITLRIATTATTKPIGYSGALPDAPSALVTLLWPH